MAGSKTLELDLLENAIDSMVHGLEHYVEGNRSIANYKFAILHITQGVELILKEKLSREHWVLIYEKVEKPHKSRTIGFETAVERLQSVCNISLDKYIRGLRRLRNARHEIEHYKVSLSEQEATALIGSNIPFLMEFLEDELETTLKEHIADEEIWQELLLIKEVYSLAKQKAEEEVTPLRWEERDGGYFWLKSCPACGEEYLMRRDRSEQEAECLLCKHVSELKSCWRCGELFPSDDWLAEGGLCEDCTAYMREPNT